MKQHTLRALALASLLSLFCAVDGSAEVPEDLELVAVTSVSDRAVLVRNAGDGSNRLFIGQQDGVIRVYDLDTDTLLPTPFLDLSSLVDDSQNEQGLLGLAFDPDYATNGRFFVNYTRDPAGVNDDRTVIARYTVSAGDPNVANPASATTILEFEQYSWNHNGGDIHFGPDGYLYIASGDGGGGGDTENFAQTRTTLLGKMLRIDVSGKGFLNRGTTTCGLVGNYAIPPDNPFLGDATTCDEIWHLGLRNPWRFSFDRLTGDMFIGDVGQGSWEEIDFQPASSSGGENWGWRCYEGAHPYNTSGCGPEGDYEAPILEYNQAGSPCAVTGGFRYRGSRIAGLQGLYVYGDYCSGDIWFASDDGGWSSTEWTQNASSPATFGEDESGELYIGSGNGTVYLFFSATVFSDGFESGDVSAW